MKHESLGDKLRTFYGQNPTEMLTFADIEAKFDAKPDNIRLTLQNLRKQGIVKMEYVVLSGAEL